MKTVLFADQGEQGGSCGKDTEHRLVFDKAEGVKRKHQEKQDGEPASQGFWHAHTTFSFWKIVWELHESPV